MKKWLLSVLVILVVLSICSFVFIPSTLKISSVSIVSASGNSTSRYLFDTAAWKKWWSVSDSTGQGFDYKNGQFIAGDNAFTISKPLHMAAEVSVLHNGDVQNSMLVLIPKTTDTCLIQWESTLETGINPLTRFLQYRKALSVKKSMDRVINHFRIFAENPENVYGIRFTRTTIKDTIFISKKEVYPHIPTTPELYHQVDLLSAYAEKNGAMQVSAPIYNIMRIDSIHYQLMTAVPINKKLAGDATYSFKRMIPGSFIVTEVKGGDAAIETASNSLDLFFRDYQKTSMAINFRMLITNRLETPDSTQWITRLYHPVY